MNNELYFATLEGMAKDSILHRVFCGSDKDNVLRSAIDAWATVHCGNCFYQPDSYEAVIKIYKIENRFREKTQCFEPLSSSIQRALDEDRPNKYKWNQLDHIFALVSS